ncbi:pyridoxal phosphate-dependent aminotransferase [Mariniblastus fucicola]|uniref:Aminotransferase n=1 Tax=Mariniblastus fucicola TaxID=980251 RepID=A0A5B9P5Q0_9BACT|nr:pyridoxal phosphate-dependent aminotransferase [Mariniblastus fucicola]QEG21718.1 Aspartate aminotransferase [Mariniblastus fucicola]
MPNIASHAKELPASPIRKLMPFADAARAAGKHVFHLNIGQPDIATPPAFFDAVRDADLEVLAYSPSAGIAPLRQKIVDYYGRIGTTISVDNVLVTTGASEALQFVLNAILDPGDEVIVMEPFYANYLSFCLQNLGTIVPVTTSVDDNFALPSVAAFEEKISAKTRAIMICNPSNPTGVCYDASTLHQLEQIAKKHNLFLITDEVYREFIYGDTKPPSALTLEGMEEHVIVIDSISKRFSACGARIGCMVTRNQEVFDTTLKMAQARLSPPTFGQLGAAAVYDLPDSYYDGVVTEYSARRDLLKASLDRMEGVTCPDINGAFYAMVRLPVEDAEDFCRWMLESFDHHGATVMMAPGAGFYATEGLGKNEVRIAYVLNEIDLGKAMACLSEGLKAYNS